MKIMSNQSIGKFLRGGLRGLLAVGLFGPLVSAATDTTVLSPESSGDVSLEELVNIKVTSVSKKAENLNDAPAAISVLSNDDLRRSGATSVAEALRLVPGLDVGQVNSSQWAISSRGFNNVYANKLLVLMDGRAVYTPLFAGVYWDLQQPMLEDVDRIEVIRGPGATLWGANAVNGVINVVTRSAKDTQGAMIYGGGGDVHQAMGGARYGGQIGDNTYYRVFGSYQLNDDSSLANGQSARDGWQSVEGGFRLDHYPQADTHLTWQADTTVSDLDDHTSDGYNVNTLGRWTRELSERASLEAQAYYDRTYRNEAIRSRYSIDTVDLSLQHMFGLGERNDVIWGLGYRFMVNGNEQTNPNNSVHNGSFNRQIFSAFVQDEFKIVPDKFTLTAGTKLEHNDITGFEIQPSIRAVCKPAENQTVWAAVSRAVRTPNDLAAGDVFAIGVGAPIPGPGGGLYVPTLVSGSNLKSEVLWAYELGYRIQPCNRISVDIATFYNNYSDLLGFGNPTQFTPGTPYGVAKIPWANNQSGHTYGGEVSVTVTPADNWRLIASYSLLKENIHGQSAISGGDPQHQVTLRSSYDFTKHASLDAQIRYVSQFSNVPAYVTADVRLSYRLTARLELSLVGQNLFEDRHLEQGSIPLTATAEIPRGFYGKITWRF
jgi:iron complex outermembrane receptor protein